MQAFIVAPGVIADSDGVDPRHLGGLHQIASSHFRRIDAELAPDAIDDAFHRHEAGWLRDAAESAGRTRIGDDRGDLIGIIPELIRPHDHAGTAGRLKRAAEREARIGAAVGEQFELEPGNDALSRERDIDVIDVVARVDVVESSR